MGKEVIKCIAKIDVVTKEANWEILIDNGKGRSRVNGRGSVEALFEITKGLYHIYGGRVTENRVTDIGLSMEIIREDFTEKEVPLGQL